VGRYQDMGTGRTSEQLLAKTGDLLAEAGWTPRDLECIGYVDGPGSFTGLRIGLSTALGLEAALGVKLAGIGTFEALAESLRPQNRPVLCLEDARIGHFYAALWNEDGSAGLPEGAYPAEQLKTLLDRPGLLFAGRAWGSRNGEVFGPRTANLEAPELEALSALVYRRIQEGRFTQRNDVRPRYLGIAPVQA